MEYTRLKIKVELECKLIWSFNLIIKSHDCFDFGKFIDLNIYKFYYKIYVTYKSSK